MSGTLRGDLCKWMYREEKKADLVIAMGTSLCGMNADRMVSTPGTKYTQNGAGLGAVIIGFQRTVLDELSSLRIYARIDEVMLLLALEMNLPVQMVPYVLDVPQELIVDDHIFLVPYDRETGVKNGDGSLSEWNLTAGAKLKLTGGPGVGFEGHVVWTPHGDDHGRFGYTVQFPCNREGSNEFGVVERHYMIGIWYIESACKGLLPKLPVVNIDD